MTNKDYYLDVKPFQYYNSTANPRHLPPTSTTLIGYDGDEANHQNDLDDFWNSAFS
jgi:phospholipase C